MELKNLSIRQLNNLFIEKKAKPSELYSDIFDTSANSESLLHAHLTLFEEKNIENAKNSDNRFENGKSTGLLDGIPIAIKDNINIRPIYAQKKYHKQFYVFHSKNIVYIS